MNIKDLNNKLMYTDTCTVIEYRGIKDPITKITKHEEVIILENQPCRLSLKDSSPSNEEDETHSSATKITKLFISPDIRIREGSKIIITKNGVTRKYQSSGIPSIYEYHQEIGLRIFKGWI